MTTRSVEAEHLSNWVFADRVTRYGLIPLLLAAILVARFFGLPYPFKLCGLVFLWFVLYNRLLGRFLKRRSRWVADTTVYFLVLLLDTLTLAAAIHATGGVESVLVPLTAVIVLFGALFLTFGQCLFISLVAAGAYSTVLALEYAGLLPHYHIFPAVGPMLYANGPYVLLICFGVVVVLITLGFITGHLATLRRRHSERLAHMHMRLQEWNRDLELHVEEKTRHLKAMHEQLQHAYLQTVTAFSQALEAKDAYTRNHSHNVATYAKLIGEELGMEEEQLQRLIQGCELHDIGKIAIPDNILLKKGPLTTEEYEVVKQHPVWGGRILEPLTFLKDVTEMVRQEHERWDGRGYPAGLKGEEIRLEARIIAVGDAWDAMTSARPYRGPMTREAAVGEIRRGAGTQFDPFLVDVFLRVIEQGKLPEFAPIEDVTKHLPPAEGTTAAPSGPAGPP